MNIVEESPQRSHDREDKLEACLQEVVDWFHDNDGVADDFGRLRFVQYAEDHLGIRARPRGER